MENETSEVFKLRQAVATQAIKDPDFLEALKTDPRKALTEFTGTDWSGVNVQVVEEDGDTLVLPIPKISGDLTADQLEAVAGGAFFVMTAATAASVSAIAASTAAATAVAGVTYAIVDGERS